MTFGSFISTRRKEAKLNLRDTAKHLGISNGYLCDIEQGRRPAPEEAFVERISSFLELDKQEHEILLDLAADSRKTVPADLPDYIRQHDIVRAALRVAKEVDATDEEWKAFMEMLQNRQNYPYVSRIVGPDPKYRFARKFLQYQWPPKTPKGRRFDVELPGDGVYEVGIKRWNADKTLLLERQVYWLLLLDGNEYTIPKWQVLPLVEALRSGMLGA